MATERIVIIVSENGTDQVIRKIKGVGDQSKQSASSVNFLQNALALLGSAATLKGFVDLLDTFTEITNKLRTVSKSEEEAAFASQKLLDVANASRSSFEDTVTLYQRVVRSTEQLGISHANSARIVETLNKATIVGGASAREASAALIQLSQGFSAGVLRGQELRSVMTQMPLVADILAQKLNTTIGGLLKLGPQGKISAKIMADALLEASDRIDKAFEKTVPTISQQFTVLKNNVIKFVGDINTRFNVLGRTTAVIDTLSEHIDAFARGVLAGSLVLGLTKALSVLNALTAALAANPLGAIALAITAAGAALVVFSDQIKLTADGTATLADFAAELFTEMGEDVKFLANLFTENFSFIGEFFRDIFGRDFSLTFKDFLTLGAKVIDSFIGTFVGAAAAITEAFRNVPATVEAIFKSMINALIGQIESFINSFVKAINTITDSALGRKLGLGKLDEVALPRVALSKEAEATGKAIGQAFVEGFNSVEDAQKLVDTLAIKAENRANQRLKKQQEDAARLKTGRSDFEQQQSDAASSVTRATEIDQITEHLNDENEALSRVIGNRKISSEYVRIELALRKKGIELTDDEREGIQNLLEQNEGLKLKQQLYQQIIGPTEEFAKTQEQLNNLFKDGTFNIEQYTVALRQAQIRQLESNRDVASGFQRGFLKIQDEITNFADLSEKTVTNAFHNMEDALVDFVTTGKFNFSSLVDSILSDLTRLLIRQAFSGLASSFGGPLGSIFGALGGLRAEGGPVTPGKAYVVGEKGPEIFQPTSGGTIIPNGAAVGSMPAPQVHVNVVNVTDPEEISSTLASPGSGEIFVNQIRRNRTAVKQALGIG